MLEVIFIIAFAFFLIGLLILGIQYVSYESSRILNIIAVSMIFIGGGTMTCFYITGTLKRHYDTEFAEALSQSDDIVRVYDLNGNNIATYYGAYNFYSQDDNASFTYLQSNGEKKTIQLYHVTVVFEKSEKN